MSNIAKAILIFAFSLRLQETAYADLGPCYIDNKPPLFYTAYKYPPSKFIEIANNQDTKEKLSNFMKLEESYINSIDQEFMVPAEAFHNFNKSPFYAIGKDYKFFTIHLTLANIAHQIGLSEHTRRHLVSSFEYLEFLFPERLNKRLNLRYKFVEHWEVRGEPWCTPPPEYEYNTSWGKLEQILAEKFAKQADLYGEFLLADLVRKELMLLPEEN